ncbi:MAG TPA: ATP-binding protein [Candidatus Acidoferrales bacterium]|nr:ATP-binding protein [Candidatus Acidoferrales bacterium]
MLTRLPLSRVSFRWQITLLGAVVVVLFVATLIATLAALQYTKSAVLNNEKRRLFEAANLLARNFSDKARSTSLDRGLLSVDFSLVSSPEATAELSQSTLQRIDGIGGGFYRNDGDLLLGYTPAAITGNRPLPGLGAAGDSVQPAILEAARNAARNRSPSEKVLTNGNDILLIEAAPIHDEKSSWGSAWSIEQLQTIPGANRLRAYLITVVLGVSALVCVILTLLLVRNLQAGVRKIEGGLKNLEGDLTSQIPTGSDPEEIRRIAQAINRLSASLKENIEREKQIEDRLRHAERLAALGRLVAGVAHEVRNPLATIRLRVQMAQREARNPRVDESCVVAFEEIERLNGMVNRLLNFSRPVRFLPEPTDLNQLAEQRLNRFLENAERHGIHIVTAFSQDGTLLPIDRTKMAQVFDNVIQNAIEAMTESGGTLWVSVTSTENSASGTDKVRVEFRDSGNGISSNMISRVFDPFFTTKPSGTGLGLSISHEFVRAHGGEIQVESAEGTGTSVRIILPVRDVIADNVVAS